jgi:superfamily I DNA and RNA helicase
VIARTSVGPDDQDAWVAEQIKINLRDDELEHDDILIVLPDPYVAKSRAMSIRASLLRHGIDAHLVGVTSSTDEVFRKDSIAITHIYRAKGNEAPMVYVLDSHQATVNTEAVTRRNKLFTAITRSRAWVRICGWGDAMNQLVSEIEKTQASGFVLGFRVPTADELAKMRRINRDRTRAELQRIEKAKAGLTSFLSAMEKDEIDMDSLSPAQRTKLAKLLRQQEGDYDEFRT